MAFILFCLGMTDDLCFAVDSHLTNLGGRERELPCTCLLTTDPITLHLAENLCFLSTCAIFITRSCEAKKTWVSLGVQDLIWIFTALAFRIGMSFICLHFYQVVALLSHPTGSLNPADVTYSYYQPAHSYLIRAKLLSCYLKKNIFIP